MYKLKEMFLIYNLSSKKYFTGWRDVPDVSLGRWDDGAKTVSSWEEIVDHAIPHDTLRHAEDNVEIIECQEITDDLITVIKVYGKEKDY